MEWSIGLRGEGRVEVAAYGSADAEHVVEKEIGRLWPEARVTILGLRRTGERGRIVEEFEIHYRLDARLAVRAPTREAAPAEAFRLARGRLADSRYSRTAFGMMDDQ